MAIKEAEVKRLKMTMYVRWMSALCVSLSILLSTACDSESSGGSSGEIAGDTSGGSAGDDNLAGTSNAGEMSSGVTTAGEVSAGEVSAGEIAGEVAGEVAGEIAGETPERAVCVEYCDTMAQHCTEDNAQFEDRDACMSFCTALPEGAEGDTQGDSVYCRLYYGGDLSINDPDFYCAHAGTYHVGLCVDNAPAPCARLCVQVGDHCEGEYAIYSDLDECINSCRDLPAEGTIASVEGDTVLCRDRYALLARHDPTLCLVTARDGGGICVDSETTRQIDRVGRPGTSKLLITEAHRDLYNSVTPNEWAFFVPEIMSQLHFLNALDGNMGNSIATVIGGGESDVLGLAEILARDYLTIDTSFRPCESDYFFIEVEPYLRGMRSGCGGRVLSENGINMMLGLLVDAGFTINGMITVTIGEGVVRNDVPFIPDFPYLAQPHAD